MRLLTYIYKAPPIIKALMVLISISLLLLALHDVLFNITQSEIRIWIMTNLNVSLILTTFNTTILFSIVAMINKEKGENAIKHKETTTRIRLVGHHSKSNKNKIEILTRKFFALEGKVQIIEDIVLNDRKQKES